MIFVRNVIEICPFPKKTFLSACQFQISLPKRQFELWWPKVNLPYTVPFTNRCLAKDPPKPKAKAKSKPEAPDGDNNAKDAGK